MMIVLYSLVWLIICLISSSISFFAGRRQVADSCYLPWVERRSWAPDPADDSVAVIRPLRRPAA